MIAHFLKSYLDSELYVCDFKGDDFSYFLENEDRYFCYEDYAKGIELFYERFKARLEKSDLTTNRCILLIDEWNNFIISLDKKEQEKYKKMISTILNMSRSKNMSVICGVQRADVAYLSSSRDSYTNVVGLGALSKESIAMIFNDYKDSVTPLPRGQGYFLEDGNDIKQIIVPQVHMDKVDQMILKGIRNRNK